MSDDKKFEIAKEYVDKQLDTMKQSGSAPNNMSAQEYKALIQDVAEIIQS